MRTISTTQDEEIDCDALAELIEGVVEEVARGADVRAILPDIALHLDHCPDCRDWYETLLALARESP